MSNATAANAAAPVHTPLTAEQVQAHANAFINDSFIWLQANWLQIIIAVAVATGIVLLLHVLRRFGMKLCERPTLAAGWGGILGRAVSRTGNFFIVMTAARLVSGYADPPPVVASTILFLFTVAAVFQAALWAREIILGFVEHRTGDHNAAVGSAMSIIRLLVTFALFSIALIVVLDNLGVNVTGLVAGLGVGGIAIGLAAQGIFADLFAALAIIFDRPFRVGETITYDQTTGTVEQIGLKSTRVRAGTGEQRVIANKNLLDKEIQNITERNHRRASFVLGVAQWVPVDVLKTIPDMLKEIVEANGCTVANNGFVAFGAQSYDFQIEFDTGAAWADFFAARHAIGLAIIDKFNREKIDLAYPTQTAFTAAPDGGLIMPYPDVQPVKRVDLREDE